MSWQEVETNNRRKWAASDRGEGWGAVMIAAPVLIGSILFLAYGGDAVESFGGTLTPELQYTVGALGALAGLTVAHYAWKMFSSAVYWENKQ